MDLLKHSSRRTRLSEIVYVLLNIGLAAALLIIVLVVQSPWPVSYTHRDVYKRQDPNGTRARTAWLD